MRPEELIGKTLHKEQFSGESFQIAPYQYPALAQAVKAELVTQGIRKGERRSKEDQLTPTQAQREIASKIVDRAKVTATAQTEQFSQKAKSGWEFLWNIESLAGKIPVAGAILAAPQNLLVHAWNARERFEAERMHFNFAGEFLAEEIPLVGDVRSLLKGVVKVVGVRGWDGGLRSSFSGAIDDFIGIIPEVPEQLVESGVEKILEEPATVSWSRRNKDKFQRMATEIAVAQEMTRIRHENHFQSHGAQLISKVLIGSSRA